MDTKFVDDIRARMIFEGERTGPPEDWPQLPDLPIGRYTDEAFHQLELRRVFRRSWLFAGHIAEYPEAGSYRVLDIPLAPIVAVRGKDGQLRAFLNTCRHRGAPVVREECGTAKHLVCQFHAWSYDLAGKLVGVFDERDFRGLEKEARALTPVRCESWGGFVFVNLDPDAPPLLEHLAPLVERYGDLIESPTLRPVLSRSWDLRCNWKVAIEAFMEIYHFKVVHKDSAGPFVDHRGGVMLLHPHGHSSGFTPYRMEAVQAAGALEMFFPSGAPTVAGLSELYREANPSFTAFPNLVTPTDITGFPILVWYPLGVGCTRMQMHWYGPDWGQGDRPSAWEIKLASWDQLMAEDNRNLEPIQRSIDAAAHTGIPLNYQERRLWQFHVDIDRMIGPDRVPEHLRVPDLLAHYIEA
jgi:phenylpropionate dioxygenase-like ring-hydroxylating dioxygenase large terminal subunit